MIQKITILVTLFIFIFLQVPTQSIALPFHSFIFGIYQ